MATWIDDEPVVGVVCEDVELTHEDMVEAGLVPTEAEWEADYKKQILDCMI